MFLEHEYISCACPSALALGTDHWLLVADRGTWLILIAQKLFGYFIFLDLFWWARIFSKLSQTFAKICIKMLYFGFFFRDFSFAVKCKILLTFQFHSKKQENLYFSIVFKCLIRVPKCKVSHIFLYIKNVPLPLVYSFSENASKTLCIGGYKNVEKHR